jgi:vitamin B12 transporter
MGQQNIRFFVGKNLSTHSDIDFSYQSEFYQADLDAGPFVDDRDYRVVSSNHAFRAQFHQQFVRGDLFLRLFQDITHRFFRNDSTDIPVNAWSNYSESAYVGLNQGAEVYVKWKLPAGMQGIMGTELRRMSTNQSDFSVSSYGRYDSPAIAADMAKVQILGNYFTLEKHQTDRWGIELGGRWNVHSLYGNNFTYHVNPYIYLIPNGKLFANYYSSFKAPSLYQLYSPYGNQDLLAEQGKTAELGYAQKWGALNTRVVVFQQDVRDGIVFQSMDVEPYGRYANVSKQKTKGVEWELSFNKKGFAADLGYTYLDGNMMNRVNGKDSTYSSLIRRPKHQVSLRISQNISPKLSVSAFAQYVGDRMDYYFDDASYRTQEVALKGYVWTELQSSYALTAKWRLQILLKNALNQAPVELYGYSGQPRNMQISLLGKF